jgi:hypothetical protein
MYVATELIVSPSDHNKGLVNRQVVDSMANSSTWWNTSLLDFLPFDIHNLAFAHKWLEVFQLILKHTFRISTSKEINSFKNGITHPGDIMSHVILFFGLLHSTGCLLHDWVYHLFAVDP